MSRKRVTIRKRSEVDAKYNSELVYKFITRMMERGKYSVSSKILYDTLDIMKEKLGKEPLEILSKAMENVKPVVEVKSRRVGGSTYQVPVEIREERRNALAMRWLISFARARSGKSMCEKLSAELIDAFNNTGNAIKKKEDTHKMAEANKAFAHYRW
jgi:small subunit ribosomal protein S7